MPLKNIEKASTKKITERNERIRKIFENHELETKLAVLEKANDLPGRPLELIESGNYFGDAPGNLVDRTEFLSDTADFFNTTSPYAQIGDREEGALAPFFRSEVELFWILGRARLVSLSTPFSFGALNTLTNYVFGNEWKYEIKPAEGFDVPDTVVARMNRVLQRILDVNDWPGHREREGHQRSHRDGEMFLRIKLGPDKLPRFRFIEPEQIVEPLATRELEEWVASKKWGPGDARRQSWKFGVHTAYDDTEEVYGYHVMHSLVDSDWDYIPASRMVHIKRNVDLKIKRGISDFYIIRGDLEREAKLRRNMAEGAALQAAIAWVFEPPPLTSQAGVTGLIKGNATHKQQVDYPSKTSTLYGKKYEPGTILYPPSGSQYKPGPSASGREAGFEMIQGAVHRAIGRLWDMPEFMISMDASNSNFASTLVAESPFVKAREHDQAFYMRHYRSLLWKALKIAHRIGIFDVGMRWRDIEAAMDIHIDVPTVDSRDKSVEANNNQIYMMSGVKSRRTVANELGLDYDEEVDRMKEEPQIGVQDKPPTQSMNFGTGKSSGFSDADAKAAKATGPHNADTTGDEKDAEQVSESGELNDANRRKFASIFKSTKEVLGEIEKGDIEPLLGAEMLKAIGIADNRAEALSAAAADKRAEEAMVAEACQECCDHGQDEHSLVEQLASELTSDDAKQLLESAISKAWESYP